MPHISFQEFRDENRDVSYPFVDGSSLTDTTGTVTIPKSLFIDASIYFPGAEAPLFLHTLVINGSTVSITIMDSSRGYEAVGELDIESGVVTFKNDTGLSVGLLVSEKNKLASLSSIPEGHYTFLMKDASFVPRCIIPITNSGVTSVGITDAQPLYGDIWLCGADGIIIRKTTTVDDTTKIRFDIVGDPLYKQALCGNDFEAPNMLRTINEIPANEYGSFILTTTNNDVLRISTDENGITISAAGF